MTSAHAQIAGTGESKPSSQGPLLPGSESRLTLRFGESQKTWVLLAGAIGILSLPPMLGNVVDIVTHWEPSQLLQSLLRIMVMAVLWSFLVLVAVLRGDPRNRRVVVDPEWVSITRWGRVGQRILRGYIDHIERYRVKMHSDYVPSLSPTLTFTKVVLKDGRSSLSEMQLSSATAARLATGLGVPLVVSDDPPVDSHLDGLELP